MQVPRARKGIQGPGTYQKQWELWKVFEQGCSGGEDQEKAGRNLEATAGIN